MCDRILDVPVEASFFSLRAAISPACADDDAQGEELDAVIAAGR